MKLRALIDSLLQKPRLLWGAAAISSVVPVVSVACGPLLALVTLVCGIGSGSWLLLWVTVPATLFFFFNGASALFLAELILSNILLWLAALVLRRTRCWQRVFQLVTLGGVLAVLVTHLVHPDIAQVWLQTLKQAVAQLSQTMLPTMSETMQQQLSYESGQLAAVSRTATGMQVVGLMLGIYFSLALARGIQAWLYNPGGLRRELLAIRLPVGYVLLLLFCAAGAVLGIEALFDSLPVMLLPCVLVGLSLVHSVWFSGKRFALCVLYVLMVFILLYMSMLLSLLAAVDSLLDFRNRNKIAE